MSVVLSHVIYGNFFLWRPTPEVCGNKKNVEFIKGRDGEGSRATWGGKDKSRKGRLDLQFSSLSSGSPP